MGIAAVVGGAVGGTVGKHKNNNDVSSPGSAGGSIGAGGNGGSNAPGGGNAPPSDNGGAASKGELGVVQGMSTFTESSTGETATFKFEPTRGSSSSGSRSFSKAARRN